MIINYLLATIIILVTKSWPIWTGVLICLWGWRRLWL